MPVTITVLITIFRNCMNQLLSWWLLRDTINSDATALGHECCYCPQYHLY